MYSIFVILCEMWFEGLKSGRFIFSDVYEIVCSTHVNKQVLVP